MGTQLVNLLASKGDEVSARTGQAVGLSYIARPLDYAGSYPLELPTGVVNEFMASVFKD